MQSNVPKCIYKKVDVVYLVVRAKAGSKKEGITEICEEYVGIAVKAQPVDGQANKAIIECLADIFGISKKDVSLERGSTNKNKIISLHDTSMSEEEIYDCLKNNMI
jgi:uncharacterized protein (TIGR00251 family)